MEIIEINSFIKYFENIHSRTMNVIKCIPEDKINWSPKIGKMTFGDIIRHLALAERYLFVGIAKFEVNQYPGFEQGKVNNYRELIEYFVKAHQESMAMLKTMDNAELLKKITVPGGNQITMWKWLRAMIEHEVHHRGAIYCNLSLLDIKTPPLFGLEEKEIRVKH